MAFTKTNWSQIYKPTSPAVVALLIQVASVCALVACLAFAWQIFHYRFSITEALCFQAVAALAITRWCNLAWWWCLIQSIFPFALVFMLTLSLSPWVYLSLFLILLMSYWSTYRTQVPYYPSTKNAWLAIEKLLPADRAINMIDIGSGLGGLILHMGKKYPSGSFTGVEIAPLPWLLSYLRNVGHSKNTQFHRGSYENIDFAAFDVVFAYLSPAAMPALWDKAKKEMRPGTMLISYEFPVVGVVEHRSVYPENNQNSGRKLYIWYL